jgi:hypothetical protein
MREYTTFAGFARHLDRLAGMGNEVSESIAEQSANLIRDDAKAKLGTYQPATGGFNAWAPLSLERQTERVLDGFTANEPLLASGQLRDAIEASLQPGGAAVGVPHGPHIEPGGRIEDVGQIALEMETGSGGAPPRPFLGPAAFEAKPRVGKLAGRALVAWLVGANWLRPPQSITLP